jgi:hypothetical protein
MRSRYAATFKEDRQLLVAIDQIESASAVEPAPRTAIAAARRAPAAGDGKWQAGEAGRGRNCNQIGRHIARRPIAMVYPPAAARQLLRAFSDVFPFDSAIPVLSGDIGAADALLPWTALPPAGRAVAFEVDVTALGCASLLACAHAVAEPAAPNAIATKLATSALFIRISFSDCILQIVCCAASPSIPVSLTDFLGSRVIGCHGRPFAALVPHCGAILSQRRVRALLRCSAIYGSGCNILTSARFYHSVANPMSGGFQLNSSLRNDSCAK